MKTIVVPTDFSPVAVNALNYAADMATALKASITLLHVYQIPVSYTDSQAPLPVINVSDIEELNQKQLSDIKADLEKVTGGTLTINAELRLGMVEDELQSICEELNPFAVVMGTRGASRVERLFLGSTTLSVLRKLTTPLVVVPPGAIYKGINKIGLACDFKAVAETIPAETIKNWVKIFDAELLVLNVDFDNRNFKPDTPEQSVVLHTLLKEAKPKYYFVESENVEDGISDFAEKNNVDLIVTVPKKQRLLDRLFQKSHTSTLAVHSHIPILSIHEGD